MSKKPNPQPQLTKDQTQTPDEPSVIARPLVRLLAILYDGMLILAMLFLVGAILSVVGTLLFLQVGTTSQEAQTLPLWYQNGIMTPAFVLTLVGFYGLFWRKSGQTLGMQTWRLKTVDSQGHFLTWGQSFRRIFSACLLPLLCATIGSVLYESRMSVQVSAFLGFLFNYLFCLVNRQGLAVHDILSNTMTLKVPKIQHESLWQTFKKRKQSAEDLTGVVDNAVHFALLHTESWVDEALAENKKKAEELGIDPEYKKEKLKAIRKSQQS